MATLNGLNRRQSSINNLLRDIKSNSEQTAEKLQLLLFKVAGINGNEDSEGRISKSDDREVQEGELYSIEDNQNVSFGRISSITDHQEYVHRLVNALFEVLVEQEDLAKIDDSAHGHAKDYPKLSIKSVNN